MPFVTFTKTHFGFKLAVYGMKKYNYADKQCINNKIITCLNKVIVLAGIAIKLLKKPI